MLSNKLGPNDRFWNPFFALSAAQVNYSNKALILKWTQAFWSMLPHAISHEASLEKLFNVEKVEVIKAFAHDILYRTFRFQNSDTLKVKISDI